MSDYTELKRLAEAATKGPWIYSAGSVDEGGPLHDQFPMVLVAGEDPIIGEEGFYSDIARDEANAEFIAAANPAAVLALIAENERLERLFDQANKCVDRVNAMYKRAWFEKLGEHYPDFGGFGDKLSRVEAERDQLKAENERLKADHDLLMSNALPREFIKLRADYDQLRAELKGLRTGFDAQNEVIAGLKSENEKLHASKLYWVTIPGNGLVRCVPDDRYRKFSPSIRARYEPVRIIDAAMGKGGEA